MGGGRVFVLVWRTQTPGGAHSLISIFFVLWLVAIHAGSESDGRGGGIGTCKVRIRSVDAA